MNLRTCILTRETTSRSNLLRFVVDPRGVVVPDIKECLPGRGLWLKGVRECVEMASKRNLFSRGFRKEVHVPDTLAETVETLLVKSTLGSLSLARKSGGVSFGSSQVILALKSGKVRMVLHTIGASDDGIRKISQAIHAYTKKSCCISPYVGFIFTNDEMQLIFDHGSIKHVAVFDGNNTQGLIRRIERLRFYREGLNSLERARGTKEVE